MKANFTYFIEKFFNRIILQDRYSNPKFQNLWNLDVFKKFKEGEGFMSCLTQDVMGLLSLYEATQLALPEEQILEEAKEFSVKHLQCLREDRIDVNLVEQVRHSLEAPLHWLMPRLEARRFIDAYEKDEGKISCLLELAKLDFNVVQAMH